MNSSAKEFTLVQKMAFTALLIALAAVFNYFTKIEIPIGGGLYRISLSLPFLLIICMLMGIRYGCMSAFILDLLSYFMKPSVYSFNLFFTFSLVAYAFMAGLLWKSMSHVSIKLIKVVYTIVIFGIGATSIVNFVVLHFFRGSAYYAMLKTFQNDSLFTLWFLGVFIAGFLLLLSAGFLSKKSAKNGEKFFKIIITVGISGIFYTVLNTFLLQIFYFNSQAYLFLLLPRLVLSFLFVFVNSYIILFLLIAFEKANIK